MKRFLNYKTGIIILLLFVFASCEKIIDLDLKQTDNELVVEAVVSTYANQSVVKLSKSEALFSKDNYLNVSHANVQLKTSTGDAFTFVEEEEGVYRNPDFIGVEGEDYALEIDLEDITIKSNSKMPEIVPIDSIELVVSDRGFMGNDDIAYSLKVHFTDPAETANYYRLDIFRNDSLYDGFYVSNDLFYNGISSYQFVMGLEMKPMDTIGVQLSSIDEANYSYLSVLSKSNSPFNIAPGNPVSNLQGKAIGYFGAYAQDRKYIVIPSLKSLR